MNKKIIWGIVIIVVLAIAGWSVFNPRYTKLKRSPPIPLSDAEIINWKTYSNEDYGFEIKYPQEIVPLDGYFAESAGYYYLGFDSTEAFVASNHPINLKIYPNQTTVDKFIEYFKLNTEWRNIMIDGLPAKESVAIGQNGVQFVLIAVVRAGNGYVLASTVNGDAIEKDVIEVVRAMATTIKFADTINNPAKL